ncbi:MAG: hypothetical protein ACOX9R_11050 [Armatimonadota bacterium]
MVKLSEFTPVAVTLAVVAIALAGGLQLRATTSAWADADPEVQRRIEAIEQLARTHTAVPYGDLEALQAARRKFAGLCADAIAEDPENAEAYLRPFCYSTIGLSFSTRWAATKKPGGTSMTVKQCSEALAGRFRRTSETGSTTLCPSRTRRPRAPVTTLIADAVMAVHGGPPAVFHIGGDAERLLAD